MSLYYDAASVLSNPDSETGGSFKSRIYNKNSKLKSPPAQIYALVSEAAKWDTLLKEVVENAGILPLEPKLTPLLSVLLVHDLLLSKNGIAAPSSHPLRVAIERHKTRLKAEFVKVRIRRGCASVQELKDQVLKSKKKERKSPRWVRINNVVTDIENELKTTFESYRAVSELNQLSDEKNVYYRDSNIPDLLAFPQDTDIASLSAYTQGKLIIQDKASCFPAYLLLGDESDSWKGDIIDACAAPGNKTTHLASLLCSKKSSRHAETTTIFSLDASQARSKTLQKMVHVAGADKNNLVKVLPGQDFLAVDPTEKRFRNVTALLLDPSCSGSGIVGRDDVPVLALPAAKSTTTIARNGASSGRSKKRKRGQTTTSAPAEEPPRPTALDESNNKSIPALDIDRLTKLSNLQLRIIEHAFAFPAATRVTYSTCSVHCIENERVVFRALNSEIAKRRGWRVLTRESQVEGLKKWEHRGIRADGSWGLENGGDHYGNGNKDGNANVGLSDEKREACLRCWPSDEKCTGGFFVAGFVRDENCDIDTTDATSAREEEEEEEEWEGFVD